MTLQRVPLWIDLREVPVNKRLPYFKALADIGAERVLLSRDDPHLDRQGLATVRLDGNLALKEGTKAIGRYVQVRNGKDQERAGRVEGLLLVEATDWRVIPLENLIAARRGRGPVYALARAPGEALLFRDTLETGVDGVVLAPRCAKDIEETDHLLRKRGPRAVAAKAPAAEPAGPASRPASPPDAAGPAAAGQAREDAADTPFLHEAEILRLEDAGPGDRVCVDTTSLFRPGEGLLVGSTARGFALVHAETIESEYVRARPFRVNAGAVHSYLYAPDARTRYLSEVRAGEKVLAVHPDGVHRVLTVGRAKIERRPHTLVTWRTAAGEEGGAVLQTAETVRLVAPGGAAVAVTDLGPGDRILVHTEMAARHFGMPIDASLEER